MKYKDFVSILNEKLITFGNSIPKYDNIIIMAGGTASGKGFIINNLISSHGYHFDVDKLKSLILRSPIIKDKVLKTTGHDLSKIDLTNPEELDMLHNIVEDLGIYDKKLLNLLVSVAPQKNKPNIIFDTTLSNISKLVTIYDSVTTFGYKKENIHIVWVVNDIDISIEQNKNRGREVHSDILHNIHTNVANTMKNIFNKTYDITKYMDGDFWVVFNQKNIDNIIKLSGKNGSYIEDALYFKVKNKNNIIKNLNDINIEFINKIEKYTKINFSN